MPKDFTRLLNPFAAIRHKRPHVPLSLSDEIYARADWWCEYCEDAPATTLDHVVPFAAGGATNADNLRAACELCNFKANDRVFKTYTLKREWLRQFREKFARVRARTMSVCIQCRGFYPYGQQSATLFLCPICTRREYRIAPESEI